MTAAREAVTTYNQASTLAVRVVRDMIDMIEFNDAPLLKYLGLNNESKFRLQDWPRPKYEWFEDEMSARSGTITEAIEDDGADKSVVLGTGEGDLLRAGHIIKIDSELMLVSSVATDTATVVRPFAGSTGATHLDNAPWELVGIARNENSDYALGHKTDPANLYNYTQIFDAAVSVSRSEQKATKYGVDNTMAYEMTKLLSNGKKAGKLPILLEKSFYHGLRYAGTAAIPRTMGGFNYFVTTNVTDLSGASLELRHIEDKMQAQFDLGGKPDTLLVNSFAKRKVSEFFKGSIRTERDETIGGSVIDKIVTDFGEVNVVWDWNCPKSHVYIFEREKMGWIEYDPFSVFDLPVTVDGKIRRIVGEYGFVLLNEQAHGRIYNFSTSY